MILCYADVRVNGYILGNGPSTLTVLVRFLPYWEGWFAKDAEQFGMTEGEAVDLIRKNEEVILEEGPQRTGGIGGREVVLFIGPTRYHANEVWQVYDTWGLERRENEAVVVVHPHRDDWRRFRPDDYETYLSALEMELPDFTEAVTEANQARVTDYAGHIAPAGIEGRAEGVELPTLVTDVHSLDEFLQDTGAYSHPDGTPAQPLPPCGLAVHGEDYNYDLMIDCQTLLAAKDTLQGTATLNWSVDTAITGWDGVATSGTPSRLTELDLSSERLTGSIPAELGDLSELTHLDLSSNSLTGEIPRELGGLSNLTEIRLSGNFLTGCIPLGLKDVTTNDLSSLNLLYCPPVPEGLTVGTVAENTIPLSWSPVSNVSKYRVEYRVGYRVEWTVDDDALTTTTHTVDDLDCERVYQLRVRAYGDGTTHAADWSDPSELETETTGTCTPPTFDEVSYTFEVAEHTAVDAIVGRVSATDPADDSLTYSIIEGNDDGHFSIEVASGDIKVAAVLDYSNKSTYPLKVEVTDGTLTDTVDVTINVYVDYDMDNDGLIDVSNLAQLNAMRWDLDGNGSSTESGYAAAFPGARFDLACPSCNSSEP